MNELHPVEAAWRRFRQNKNNFSLFREAQAWRPRLLQELRLEGVLTDWPPGVALSAGAAVQIMRELARAIGVSAKPNWSHCSPSKERSRPARRSGRRLSGECSGSTR